MSLIFRIYGMMSERQKGTRLMKSPRTVFVCEGNSDSLDELREILLMEIRNSISNGGKTRGVNIEETNGKRWECIQNFRGRKGFEKAIDLGEVNW